MHAKKITAWFAIFVLFFAGIQSRAESASGGEAKASVGEASKKAPTEQPTSTSQAVAETKVDTKAASDELEMVDPEAVKEEAPETAEELYEELVGEEDDTVILPSISIDHSFSFKDDTETGTKKTAPPYGARRSIMDSPWKYTLKFTGQYTFGGPKNNDWGIKVTIPFVYNDPGDLIKKNKHYFYNGVWEKYSDQVPEYGLGDMNFKIKRSFHVTKQLRGALGMLFAFPTGKEYEYFNTTKGEYIEYNLGQNQYRFEPDLALSYRIDKTYTFTLTTSLKAGHRVGDDSTGYQMTVKPGLNIALPAKCLFSVNYTAKYTLNSSPEQQYAHDLKVKLSKKIGKLNVGIAYQNPLNLDSYYAHNVDLTMTYNF